MDDSDRKMTYRLRVDLTGAGYAVEVNTHFLVVRNPKTEKVLHFTLGELRRYADDPFAHVLDRLQAE